SYEKCQRLSCFLLPTLHTISSSLCEEMGLNFTVNDAYESAMFAYMHVVAVLSILITGPTFYLLYFKSHKNSQLYRILLIIVVVWTTLMDIHFGALFIPLPLFPIVGGYCIGKRSSKKKKRISGPLCSLGLPMHFSLTIMFLIVTGVCAAIINCFLFRHQAVLPPYSTLKISDKQFNLLCLVVYLVFETPSLAMVWAYKDTLTGEEYLMEFHPAMMWIMRKPNWVVYNTRSATSIMILVVGFYFLLFLGFGGLVFLLIGHIFYILAKQGQHMSERTRKLQRNLTGTLVLQNCSFQFLLLGTFLGIPLGVFCVSVLTYLVPYEVNWAFFCFELVHSIVHSGTLILTTRPYKDTVMEWLRIKKAKTTPRTATVSLMN
ncbi:hypothetical protein PRIPAC_74966, partial [Pristionchus pacificus]|uniref:G protein-coupled receptor n=1 Tax=Pristionchus pacificus TaxID=54126 RepID=A0A2A6CST8_PRIPA